MKKLYFILYTVLWFTLLSCQQENVEHGYLNVNVIQDITYHEKFSRSVDTEKKIKIEIFMADDKLIVSYDDIREMPQTITLGVGQYRVRASVGNSIQVGFVEPVYVGEKEVLIASDIISTVNIVCTLAQSKISVTFSEDLDVNFPEYFVEINQDNHLIRFDKTITSSAYIQAGDFSVALTLVNADGIKYRLPIKKYTAKTRDHFRFIFSLENNVVKPPLNGGTDFDIVMDDSMNQHDIFVEIPLNPSNNPILLLHGFNEQGHLDVIEGIATNAQLEIESEGGLQDIIFYTEKTFWPSGSGLSNYISLASASVQQIEQLKALGLIWPDNILGVKMATIDFTQFTSCLSVCNGEISPLPLKVIIQDKYGQQIEQDLLFVIHPNEQINTGRCNSWAKFAYVYGTFRTKTDVLGFEYRKQGTESWESVAQENIQISEKVFSAKIEGLEAQSSYEYRAVMGSQRGSIETFTTEEMVMVPNLDFETWTQNGKNWYPNTSASNSYWASGNEGVTMALVNKPANTVPFDLGYKGKAAKLTTIAVPFANLAAGNIFTGTYKTNISNPAASVQFGRPYTGRPTRLKGWYKYTSNVINVGKAPNGETQDLCHIYIWLKDASGKQIAYGEFVSDQSVIEFTPFDIEIIYSDVESKPTQFAIVATSSRYGGEFIGGVGSELLVDEFQLSFD